MRPPRQTLVAATFALALLVPALALAAQEGSGQPAPATTPPSLTPSNVAPQASLVATVQGGRVAFDASASSDADGRIVAYAWDLDGDSVYETTTGDKPALERRYPAGTALVASVRVTDDAGATAEKTATVAVQPADQATTAASAPAPTTTAAPAPAPAAEPVRDQPQREPTLRAAASKSVTIRDFEFAPATISIGVGDSVTWTNQGPSIHTATANDGSFDSGNLDRGKSYTKAFSSPGTYSYICTPHPFMTGKIVVSSAGAGGGSGGSGGSGGGGSGGSGSGSGSGTGSGTTPGTTPSAGTTPGSLARTGFDVAPWALLGFSMLAFGAALRWRLNTD